MILDLFSIIKKRLEYQSTKDRLEKEFNLNKNLSFEFLTSRGFLDSFYAGWDNDKKTSFASLLGGPANLKRTRKFLDNNIVLQY